MKFLKILVSVVVLGMVLGSVLPALADADVSSYSATCSSFSASGTSDANYVVVGIYSYINNSYQTLSETVHSVSAGHFSVHVSFDKQPIGTEINYEVWGAATPNVNDYDDGDYADLYKNCKNSGSGSGAGEIAGNLLDGRINKEADLDVAAPVAIYQDGQKTVSIWAIDPSTGAGTQAVNLPWSAIAAQGVPMGANVVLSDTTVNGLHIIVARLTTGEIQVNVTGNGANYIVAWSPDKPESFYHLSG